MYNLWPRPSVFPVSYVTVAWVAVTCCAVRCLSFPRYTFMSHTHTLTHDQVVSANETISLFNESATLLEGWGKKTHGAII